MSLAVDTPTATITGVARLSFANYRRSSHAERRSVVEVRGRRNTILEESALTEKERAVRASIAESMPNTNSDAGMPTDMIRRNNFDRTAAWQKTFVKAINGASETLRIRLKNEYAAFVVEETSKRKSERDPNVRFLTHKNSFKHFDLEFAIVVFRGTDWRDFFRPRDLEGDRMEKTRNKFFANFFFVQYLEEHYSEENLKGLDEIKTLSHRYRDHREGFLAASALRARAMNFVNDILIYNFEDQQSTMFQSLEVAMPSGLSLTEASSVITAQTTGRTKKPTGTKGKKKKKGPGSGP